MDSIKIVLLFLKFFVCDSAWYVEAVENVPLVKPCAEQDVECVKKSTKMFLENTASGIPQYDIKPIDPLPLSTLTVQGAQDLTLHFKNATIRGLKNMDLDYYKLDATTKSAFLLTRQDLTIKSDLVVENADKEQTARGTFKAKGSTVCIVQYHYGLKKDEKGVEHFDVGHDSIHCYMTDDPTVTLSEELQQALSPEKCTIAVKKMSEKNLADFVYNIRSAAKLLPRKAFFTNL